MNLTTHELKAGDLTVFAAPTDGKVAWMGSEGDDFSKDPTATTDTVTKSFAAPMLMITVNGDDEANARINLAARCGNIARQLEGEVSKFLGGSVELHEWVKDEHCLAVKEDSFIGDSEATIHHEACRIYALTATSEPPELITVEKCREMRDRILASEEENKG